MNIIGHKYVFLTISGLLVLASIFAVTVWGLKLGIDYTGGSLLEVEFIGKRPDSVEIHGIFASLGLENVAIQPTGERGMIFRLKYINEETHQKILEGLETESRPVPSELKPGLAETASLGGRGEEPNVVIEKRFDTIGPTIGRELKRNSIFALILAISAIILYIALAFRHVSKPVASWKYGVVAILALIHDVSIPTGIFAALGRFRGVEIDTLFITALLTVLGFSVHDTIVVFDRIRENLRKLKTLEPYEATVNRSVKETIIRSINTSLTVLFVLLAIFFFGGSTTQYFSLALILGILFGTYSSIFVASPLLIIWSQLTKKR